jgi:hypothetical protein
MLWRMAFRLGLKRPEDLVRRPVQAQATDLRQFTGGDRLPEDVPDTKAQHGRTRPIRRRPTRGDSLPYLLGVSACRR